MSAALAHDSRIPHGRLIERVALVLCAAYLFYVALATAFGAWIIEDDGRYVVQDFLAFWAAGRQALDGNAASAYDTVANKAAQELAVGYAFKGQYPWFYPPFYFFLLIPLALIPYGIAYAGWAILSTLLYVRVVGGIVGHAIGSALALAFPAVFLNMMSGQNGALTAALLGGSLTLMPRQPVASGICLGLMTYKPHFGVLIPLALAAGRQWRVIVSAVVTALVLGLVSWAVFGSAAWSGFFHSLFAASNDHITEGGVKWYKMQSFYAILRMHGVSESAGLIVHAALFGALGIGVFALWRSNAPFNLKAAGLAVSVPVATPYLMIYDGIVVAVPMAFLIAEGRRTNFLRGEWPVMALAAVMVGILPFLHVPAVHPAAAMVAALIARRWHANVPMRIAHA